MTINVYKLVIFATCVIIGVVAFSLKTKETIQEFEEGNEPQAVVEQPVVIPPKVVEKAAQPVPEAKIKEPQPQPAIKEVVKEEPRKPTAEEIRKRKVYLEKKAKWESLQAKGKKLQEVVNKGESRLAELNRELVKAKKQYDHYKNLAKQDSAKERDMIERTKKGKRIGVKSGHTGKVTRLGADQSQDNLGKAKARVEYLLKQKESIESKLKNYRQQMNVVKQEMQKLKD